jgi:hypothetical protein
VPVLPSCAKVGVAGMKVKAKIKVEIKVGAGDIFFIGPGSI